RHGGFFSAPCTESTQHLYRHLSPTYGSVTYDCVRNLCRIHHSGGTMPHARPPAPQRSASAESTAEASARAGSAAVQDAAADLGGTAGRGLKTGAMDEEIRAAAADTGGLDPEAKPDRKSVVEGRRGER